MSTITIGVDLAKIAFAACEVDGCGHVLWRQDLRAAANANKASLERLLSGSLTEEATDGSWPVSDCRSATRC